MAFLIEKLLLDSTHDTYVVYEFYRWENIMYFIGINSGHIGHFAYKEDFTIDGEIVPICELGFCMHKGGYEITKHRVKFSFPV